MSHHRFHRLVPLFVLISLLAYLFLSPDAARAEGGAQIGNFDQQLQSGDFYVDILSTGEVINVSLQNTFSGYAIYDPLGNLRKSGSGGQLGAGSQGSCQTLLEPITNAAKFVTDQPGAWRVVVNGNGYCWDISVTPNESVNPDPGIAAGRVWTRRYDFTTGTYAASAAIDSDFYAMTPGGLPNTNYVWQLDLNKFSGYTYSLNANDLGLDPPYSGYSYGTSGASVSDKFPLYLAYPAIARPRPETPPLASSLRFIDDAGVDVTISPGATNGVQDTGYFEFDSDINGTFALTIDTNRDGQFASGDRLILGNAVRGLNRVQWDGRNPAGAVVSNGAYQAQLKLRGGEFHFISNDVETSGGDEPGLTIRQANPDGTFTDVRVYWDDVTYLGDTYPAATSTLPDGAWSNTADGHHTWGNFNSAGTGIGNNTYLDTYVYGQTTVAIMDAVVAADDNVVSSPHMDLDADDSSGATGVDYKTVWAADGSAVAVAVVDADLTITDGDSVELTQAEITLTTPQTGDELTVGGVLPAGISIDGAGTDTFLRLTGAAPIDDYVTALGQVRFNNPLPGPSNTQRTVSLVVKDDLSNGNTAITTIFPDSDGDGVSDVDEGAGDSDLDTVPDYLDTDSDNDGIPDSVEGDADSDGDGLPDRVESNSNDADEDGIPDYLDIDSDGDGIRDGAEGTGDTDGDGLPDYLDTDSDGDGIPDSVEGSNDADGDGLPDYKDTDSDDDGIPDSGEGTADNDDDGLDDREESNARDADGDGEKDYQDTDSDGDGIPDGVEGTFDTDGDGFADYIDTDSDGDGIPDATEGTQDSDGDTLPDRLEPNNVDTDGDGVNNHLDADDDGDGLPTAVEGRGDVDNDGLPNYLDPDSDNDGFTDGEEGAGDADGDGIPNFLDPDSDGDLIKDAAEGTTDSDGDGIPDRLENNDADSDGDGIPNLQDPDDDNDGIPTAIEGDGDQDGDGIPNYLDDDSDGDGFPDAEEGTGDVDGDGIPNYLDDDSDNDGISDQEEGDADADADGIPDRLEHNYDDADGDGIPNYLDDDSDGDGIPDAEEGTDDVDGDGIPNYLDEDSDNDGISDEEEGDGDRDGDGLPDRLERGDVDSDGDGVPDDQDIDSDNDGIPDGVEGSGDLDGDGIPNYLDEDSDGDGVPDAQEGAVDDAFEVFEDSADNVLLVLANDSDYDGDPLTIVAIGIPDQGGVIVNHGSHLTYTPAPDFHGAESFIYSVGDGKGNFDTATATVLVGNVNDEPIAVDDTYTVDEDTTTLLDVLDNDSDIDEDTLTISEVGDPDRGGSATIQGDSIRYTPTGDFSGTESFTYTVEDGAGGSDTATVTVTVAGQNDAPEAADDTFTVQEDSVANALDVLDNDSDVDEDTLTITGVGAPDQGGAVTHDGAMLAYTPAADFFGTETFTYTVEDGAGGADSATVTMTVTNVNDDPVAHSDEFSVEEDSAGNPLDVLDNDGDVEGDALTITDVGDPDQGGVATTDGSVILYTPPADFSGVETFTYTVADSNGGEHVGAVTVNVNNVNDVPIAADDAFTISEDETRSFDVLANDDDADADDLTIAAVGAPDQGGSAVLDGDEILYTPATNFVGAETFTYTVEDGNGGQDSATVTVTVEPVNDDPQAVDDAFTVVEDTALNQLDVLENDGDPENDPLSLISVSAPDQGGSATISAGLIRYTPLTNFFGTETFTYTVIDGNGGADTATVTVTVTNVNDPPIAIDDDFEVDEDSVDNVFSLLDNDSDPDNDVLTVTGWGEPSHGAMVRDGNLLRYTPDPDFNGTDTFHYTITDGNSRFDTAIITVRVISVNDPPVAAGDAYTVNEDSVDNALDVLANDADPVEGNVLSISSVGSPDQGGAVSHDGSQITYTPAADFFGVETFSYTIDDGYSGQDTATVTVTVVNMPDDPTGGADSFSVEEDSVDNALDVLDNDHDADGDALTIKDVGDPDQGSASIDGDVIRYTPPADFNGEDTFTYTVEDENGGSDTATVTVTVHNVNDNPTGDDDSFSVEEDSVDNALNVLDNDDDIDPGDSVSLSAVGAPDQGGTATIDGAVIRYTPALDFVGTETFTYTVRDVADAQSEATVTVIVNAVNDAPRAVNDGRVANQGQDLVLSPLANDTDVEGDALTVTALGAPDHGGSVTLDGDTVTYRSLPGFVGVETFTYTISDGDLTAEGLVTVTVVEADGVMQIDPQSDETLVFPDGGTHTTITATVHIPAGAMGDSEDSFALVYTEIAAPGDPPLNYQFANFSFTLDAYKNEVLQPGFVFDPPITLSLQYGDADVALLDVSTLALYYWDGAGWQQDGITRVSHDEATNTIVFSIAHLTEFALAAREPVMALDKHVAGPDGGYLDLPLGAVVTYTLDLYNGGSGEATNLVVTDTLPAGVAFDRFVVDGGALFHEEPAEVTLAWGEVIQVPANTILWTGSLPSGAEQSIVFRAVLPGDNVHLGQSLTNTAYFRGENVVSGGDEATITFVPNTAPTVSVIADQRVGRNKPIGPLSFTIGDAETDTNALVVNATSSNQALVPDANLTLSGAGAERAITLQPLDNATGVTTITITVDDGQDTTTVTFTVTVLQLQYGYFMPYIVLN